MRRPAISPPHGGSGAQRRIGPGGSQSLPNPCGLRHEGFAARFSGFPICFLIFSVEHRRCMGPPYHCHETRGFLFLHDDVSLKRTYILGAKGRLGGILTSPRIRHRYLPGRHGALFAGSERQQETDDSARSSDSSGKSGKITGETPNGQEIWESRIDGGEDS